MTVDQVVGVVADMEHNVQSLVVGQLREFGMQWPYVIDERQNVDQSGSCCCKSRSGSQMLAYPAGVRKANSDARDCRLEGCSQEVGSSALRLAL
jgi:hypothetical protein